MSPPVVASKLFIPTQARRLVTRPRLVEKLNAGLQRKLTLISAPAGFGKTTLASEWTAACGRPAAWLSLDEADSDPSRFLSCLVAALRTIRADIGSEASSALQSQSPQPTESVLTALLNEISAAPGAMLLVLDDYHLVDARPVDDALAFLVERLPAQVHLAMATREDPDLPLARLRARDQLTEVRAADLRFTPAEASEFLNAVMELDLPPEEVAALESRTEGWISGLQLAAISVRGRADAASFIRSFTGSNAFVMDFLVEEVLHRQPEAVQTFLAWTSILDRFCGPLCDAVLSTPVGSAQETLEHLERANLFIVPLDGERRWYRYHHLFAELLRQRFQRLASPGAAELHVRASRWYEDNGMEIDAFRHAVSAGDVARAERLVEGKGRPLYFRGGLGPVLQWLEALPPSAMDARPRLWVTFATVLMLSGRPNRVEDKLRAAEAAHRRVEQPDEGARDLEGHMAVVRALVAASQYHVDVLRAETQRATELLSSGNLAIRTFNTLARGLACHLQGDLEGAQGLYVEAISACHASGYSTLAAAAACSLGQVLEARNQLPAAADAYRRMLQLLGDPAHPYNHGAHQGLARISYEWNDLDAALQHCEQCVHLAPLIECISPAGSQVMLARILLARLDAAGAAVVLEQAAETARQHRFEDLRAEVAAARVLVLLRLGKIAAAARLAEQYDLPMSRARVRLAQGNPSAALTVLEPPLRRAQAHGPDSERLALAVLQALALHAKGDKDVAVQLLGKALAMAEPGGFLRLFVDEGAPMARLLTDVRAQGVMPEYAARLLESFGEAVDRSPSPSAREPVEALSPREVEVLQLIAQGLSNQEIAERLFLSLSTVKGHNQNIFAKLQVQRRTEAIARARELGLA